MACSGCTNGCNTCSCEDTYRVTTGAIGPTGATGPQGPAGPAGNEEFLYIEAYHTGFPGNVGAGYQLLGSGYTLPASTLSNAGDTLIITARFKVVALDTTSKLMRVDFGSFQSTEINSNTSVISAANIQEIELTITRTGAATQLVIEDRKQQSVPSNVIVGQQNRTATETLSGTVLIRPMVNATGGVADDIRLVSFSVKKITAP